MANFNALATAGRQLEEAVRVQRMMEVGRVGRERDLEGGGEEGGTNSALNQII